MDKLLKLVSWFYMLFACGMIYIANFPPHHTCTNVQSLWSSHGVIVIAGAVLLLYRKSIGWWILILNGLFCCSAFGYLSVRTLSLGEINREAEMAVAVLLVFIASVVMLAICNPWRWETDSSSALTPDRS